MKEEYGLLQGIIPLTDGLQLGPFSCPVGMSEHSNELEIHLSQERSRQELGIYVIQRMHARD